MAASDYLELNLGNHLFRTSSYTKPTGIYVALFTTMPIADGTGGTEVTGGDYARVQHGPSNATWAVPADTDSPFTNIGTITFPTPSASWGDVEGFGLFDAASSGNYLLGQLFDAPVSIGSTDPAPVFLEGDLSVYFV